MNQKGSTTRPQLSRRRFLGRTMGAATAFSIVPRHVLGGPAYVSPNEKTTLACIGLGGQGQIDLFNLLQFDEIQVTSVCDVHQEGTGYISWDWGKGNDARTGGREPAKRNVNAHYAKKNGTAKYDGCNTYSDFRELFDSEDFDAVVIATPDHSHAVITLAALNAGKHVYCEKPLTYTVEECRQVTRAAKRAKVATQLGNQGQAKEEARVIQEFMLDDAIGLVREVHVQHGDLFWPPPPAGVRPEDTPPIPEGLDWDLWLGPAPYRPYHPAYHPWNWRDWRDFGTSALGDLGCHMLSTVFKALNLEHPTAVQAECEELGPEVHPRKFKVEYEFPARGGMPPLKLAWYDGGYKAPRPKELEPGRSVNGVMYFGDEGSIMGHRLVPESKMRTYGRPPKVLERSPGQYHEWVDACRGGKPAGSDFVAHSGLLTETPLLGVIAMRMGKRLTWDGPNMRFTNSDEANKLLRRNYRNGWSPDF